MERRYQKIIDELVKGNDKLLKKFMDSPFEDSTLFFKIIDKQKPEVQSLIFKKRFEYNRERAKNEMESSIANKKAFEKMTPEQREKTRLANEELEKKEKEAIKMKQIAFESKLSPPERELRKLVLSAIHTFRYGFRTIPGKNPEYAKKIMEDLNDESRKRMQKIIDLSGDNLKKINSVLMNDEEKGYFIRCYKSYKEGESLYFFVVDMRH